MLEWPNSNRRGWNGTYSWAVLAGILTGLCGCDLGKTERLEKENAELKAKIEKDHAVQNFELSAKCSDAARVWFRENWSPDKDTIMLVFSNHYNAKYNKCLILVEYHYNFHPGSGELSAWTNDLMLTDVYENVKYADFSQNHIANGGPNYNLEEPVVTCVVEGNQCKTKDQFSNLISPYMND